MNTKRALPARLSRVARAAADGAIRSAALFVPRRPTLESLRRAAAACTGCDLYRCATQTVFGEGARRAALVFVGESEVRVVRPRVLVCLGATAARAAFGRPVRLKDYRGKLAASRLSERTFVTIHPAAVLRLQDPERHREYRRLVEDLEQLRKLTAT